MQYTYRDSFSTAQISFWTHWFCCHLLLLPFFVSALLHQQNISLWGLFHLGKQKKSIQGKIGWIGRVGLRGHDIFGQKLWTLSAVWAGVLVNHPSWNGQMHWKSLQKNSLRPNAASQNTSWYTDPDGFPEHSPNMGNLYYKGLILQKIILWVFWGVPLVCLHMYLLRYMICKFFSWSMSCLFTLWYLLKNKVFNFNEVQFIYFFLPLIMLLVSCLRRLPTQSHKDLLLYHLL